MMIKRYSELISIPTFEERFEYLSLNGKVGEETFGFDRYMNQNFYASVIWKSARNAIIARDNACDLGLEGYEIFGGIYIHHMNPITKKDIEENSDLLINPEFLICTSYNTHLAIHYGDANLIPKEPVVRFKNDTCPWKL